MILVDASALILKTCVKKSQKDFVAFIFSDSGAKIH
jgi:hypothetical protein